MLKSKNPGKSRLPGFLSVGGRPTFLLKMIEKYQKCAIMIVTIVEITVVVPYL